MATLDKEIKVIAVKGESGKSSYDLAVEELHYSGTLEEWIETFATPENYVTRNEFKKVTQAEYDDLEQAGELIPDCYYIITDDTTYDDLIERITGIESDITDIQGDVTDIKDDITDIQGDITTIDTDVTNLKSRCYTRELMAQPMQDFERLVNLRVEVNPRLSLNNPIEITCLIHYENTNYVTTFTIRLAGDHDNYGDTTFVTINKRDLIKVIAYFSGSATQFEAIYLQGTTFANYWDGNINPASGYFVKVLSVKELVNY